MWDGCIGGIVAAAAVEAAAAVVVGVVGVVRGDGGERGLAWQGWVASFLLLLEALAQLEERQVREQGKS